MTILPTGFGDRASASRRSPLRHRRPSCVRSSFPTEATKLAFQVISERYDYRRSAEQLLLPIVLPHAAMLPGVFAMIAPSVTPCRHGCAGEHQPASRGPAP